MNTGTLLGQFETVADSPGGVAHIRSFVLRLAVSGKLVSQDPADEPACASLERSRGELAGAPTVRGRAATSQAQRGDAALFVCSPEGVRPPPGWTVAPLRDITRLESGHTPDRKVAEYWDGPFHWIGIRDARRFRNGVVFATEKRVSQAGIDNSATRLLPEGTVCLSRTASVGYAVVMGREMCTSQDFVNFVCTSSILPAYLQMIFRAEDDALHRFARGAVHLTIYFPQVKAFHILLPPLEEQRRIVARVDELMALLVGRLFPLVYFWFFFCDHFFPRVPRYCTILYF